MTLSSDPDVNAAARTEHAAIGTSRHHGRYRVVFIDHQTLRLAAALVAVVVLAGRRLIAQAELQAAVAGLQSGIVQRLLKLWCGLLQHRQRLGLLDGEMRGHL